MKKELFNEIFNYYFSVTNQVKCYDDFMEENFGEVRDANYSNWYDNQAYNHLKNIFNIYYNDDNDWLDYFIFERNFGKKDMGDIISNNIHYPIKSIDDFYIFCENELTKK